MRRGDAGQAEGRLRAGPRQRGPGARIAGRRWSRGALQHLDPLGQGSRSARPAAARRRIRLRARPGDAARHLAASGDVRARPASPSPCSAPAWCWPTRAGCSSNTIRGSPASRPRRSCSRRRASWRASARSASSTTPASCSPPAPVPTPSSHRRWPPSPAPWASGSAPTGWATRIAKAGSSGPFAYVETNFLAGRSFADFDDLNRQALAWCRDVANRKPKQALGMSPEAAYRHRAAAPRAAARRAAAGLRVARTRRRSARLCLGRHQSLFRPRALRRQVGRRLPSCRPRSMSAARTPRSPSTAG